MVIDASVAAIWLFEDERSERADAALVALQNEVGLVPQLWHLEMRNMLLMAVWRERISLEDAGRHINVLAALPVQTDEAPDLAATFDLANRHSLTFYDGLYLELACRRRSPLATADRRLLAAARSEGVAWD